jgi:hypothetical protein
MEVCADGRAAARVPFLYIFPAAHGGRLAFSGYKGLRESAVHACGKGYIDPKQNCVVTVHG